MQPLVDTKNMCFERFVQKQRIFLAKAVHAEEQAHAAAMAAIEANVIKIQSEATVAERNAVQPGLIEALSGFGEAHLAGKAAENMGLISLVKGEDVMTLLGKFFGASRPAQVLKKMKDKYGNLVDFGSNGDDTSELPPSSPRGGSSI